MIILYIFNMKRSVLLFLCFIMLSCSKTGEPVGDLDIINVDINEMSSINEFVCGESKYICLDSSENCLIEKVDKVMISQDTLFVMDRSRRTVFVFSANDGRFINKISKTGRGPGEYIDLSDCDIWHGNIYIVIPGSKAKCVFTQR